MEHAEISYRLIEGIPNERILKSIDELYTKLFEDADVLFFNQRLHEKTDFVFILAFSKENLIGFKIGYKYAQNTFYSWVGGVNKAYRRQGIGNTLAQLQTEHAKKVGYNIIRTKSMNRFKPMIILNLKNGFDITSVYTNTKGQTKIVFEKHL